MDSKLIDNARRTLEAERARIRLELSEEVEHPHVAHGAQTAAATEVSESQRGQQLREREELHLGQIEARCGGSRRELSAVPDVRQADSAGAPGGIALARTASTATPGSAADRAALEGHREPQKARRCSALRAAILVPGAH